MHTLNPLPWHRETHQAKDTVCEVKYSPYTKPSDTKPSSLVKMHLKCHATSND